MTPFDDNYCGCAKDVIADVEPQEDNIHPQVALAMAYVPFQEWEDIYSPEKALERGTLFQQLDKPFLGGMK